jgi:GTP-binding protein
VAALELTFVTSADVPERLERSTAEVAVVGRSNVGKSSLLNAMANQRQLARTSSTPGRTQLLNQFRLRGGGTLVDLPGYGFAKAPQQVREAWRRRMFRYLEEREPLVMVLLLVDGAVGPTSSDLEMLARLRSLGRTVTVVATKRDKVKSSQRVKREREVASRCGVAPDDVVWVSATKGDGVDALRRRIRAWIG